MTVDDFNGASLTIVTVEVNAAMFQQLQYQRSTAATIVTAKLIVALFLS